MFLAPNSLTDHSLEKNIHLIGASGIGMQGLHRWLEQAGYNVTASDSETKDGIPESAAPIGAELIVVSSAITEQHPQYIWAIKNSIPVIHRSQCLKQLVPKNAESISVCGAHGKTTSSALIAHILDEDCSFAVGGILIEAETPAELRESARYCVLEADESDGSMLNLYGKYGLLTNLDNEHIDHYDSFSNYLDQMKKFVNLCGTCVVHTSCQEYFPDNAKMIWYGPGSDKWAEFLAYIRPFPFLPPVMHFRLHGPWGAWEAATPLLGKHMLENILGCVTLLNSLGVDKEIILKGVTEFPGVRKRGEVTTKNDLVFVNDYAHHPNEINTTIAGYKQAYAPKTLHVFWEPHRFSRLRDNGLESFAKALGSADRVLVLPVWAASEVEIPGFSQEEIAKAVGGKTIMPQDVKKYIEEETESGDLVIAMGAGGIYKKFKEAVLGL